MLPLTCRGTRTRLLPCWAAVLLASACARSVDHPSDSPEADATLSPGVRVAALVLVAGDPTAGITATHAVSGVGNAGRSGSAAEISDFESGQPVATFGTQWFPSTDAMIGGASTVRYSVIDGGAAGSRYALRVNGTIAGVLPNAWAGVMWSPGPHPMSPENLSAHTGLRFATRGDGRQYAVLVFAQSRGMIPIMRTFNTATAWTEVSMPWSDFGVDGSGIMALLFVATPRTGDFDFRVDNVRLY
jgi:hypothetical protein